MIAPEQEERRSAKSGRPPPTRPPTWAVLAVLLFWGWVMAMTARGTVRWDHVAVAVFATVLAFSPPPAKHLMRALLPLGLVGLAYDAMRFVEHVGVSESTVHVCDLRAFELRWFGVTSSGERVTLHDWLQPRAAAWLDVVAAIPYGAFLAVVFGYCLYLFARDFGAQQRFGWAFLALNLLGFATYHLYPAAPPWYFHRYGCTVDLHAAASAGPNLTRVDAWLGVPYFAGLYGRASDVFGAMPSLHVAYPTLMLAVGWRVHGPLGRALLALFLAWMSFSAVYLDHHWVIDVIVGAVYAFAVAYGARRLASLFTERPFSTRRASFRPETGRAAG
ncbi:MAG TPA: phosphatase PAP2 family protein [Polyangiaceae bacterium]|nr:phosphatase PAP2 family protein [Polyangiaceae bacterium]